MMYLPTLFLRVPIQVTEIPSPRRLPAVARADVPDAADRIAQDCACSHTSSKSTHWYLLALKEPGTGWPPSVRPFLGDTGSYVPIPRSFLRLS